MTDNETKLARRISSIWGYPGRIHSDARDLAKVLILDGWRAPGPCCAPSSPDASKEEQ